MTDMTVFTVLCAISVAMALAALLYSMGANARSRRTQRTVTRMMTRDALRRDEGEHLL